MLWEASINKKLQETQDPNLACHFGNSLSFPLFSYKVSHYKGLKKDVKNIKGGFTYHQSSNPR